MLMWILCIISITSTVRQNIFVEKYFNSWDPKIHGPCNYLQIFYVSALIDKCGPTNLLAIFLNGISKNTILSVTGKMDNGIPSSSSGSVMTSKIKKNHRALFKIQMKNTVYLLKQSMMRCLILSQNTYFFTEAIKGHVGPCRGQNVSPETLV